MAVRTYKIVRADRNGKPLDVMDNFVSRKINRVANGIDSVEIVIPLTDPQASAIGASHRVLVYYSDNDGSSWDLFFYGMLPSENITDDCEANTRTMLYVNAFYMLTRRYTLGTENWGPFMPSGIAERLIQAQNDRTDLTTDARRDTFIADDIVGYTTGQVTVTRDYRKVRTRVYDLIQDLLTVEDSFEFRMKYRHGYDEDGSRLMGEMQVWTHETDNSVIGQKPNVVLYYGADFATTVTNVRRRFSAQTNRVTVLATDADGNKLSANAGVGNGSYATLEKVVSHPDATTQAAVTEMANRIYSEQRAAVPVYEVDEILGSCPFLPFSHYDVGDTIKLVARKGAMNVTTMVDVCEIVIDIDEHGFGSVSLTLADCAAEEGEE